MNDDSHTPEPRYPWHHGLGHLMEDCFDGLGFLQEVDKELAQTSQRLDLVILRPPQVKLPAHLRLPDGLDTLKTHNLISYKSLHEAFNEAALYELIGHFSNYRKQVGDKNSPLPFEQIQLYGLSTRRPKALHRAQPLTLTPKQPGVYDIHLSKALSVRLIVLKDIPIAKHNAIWNVLSAEPDNIRQGIAAYNSRPHRLEATLIRILNAYKLEGYPMAYQKLDDFNKDYVRRHQHLLTPEERLAGLSADERLKDLSLDEILGNLSPQQRLEFLKMLKKQGG